MLGRVTLVGLAVLLGTAVISVQVSAAADDGNNDNLIPDDIQIPDDVQIPDDISLPDDFTVPDVCGTDIISLCGGSATYEAMVECLVDSVDELSDACLDYLTDALTSVVAACTLDATLYCSGELGDDDTAMAFFNVYICLLENEDSLSSGCQDAIDEYSLPCVQEAAEYCASEDTPQDTIDCLSEHTDDLDDVCLNIVEVGEACLGDDDGDDGCFLSNGGDDDKSPTDDDDSKNDDVDDGGSGKSGDDDDDSTGLSDGAVAALAMVTVVAVLAIGIAGYFYKTRATAYAEHTDDPAAGSSSGYNDGVALGPVHSTYENPDPDAPQQGTATINLLSADAFSASRQLAPAGTVSANL